MVGGRERGSAAEATPRESTRPGRTFRIFVSSPFVDFVEERNALHDRVFPVLRDLCAARGARFQAIDLRWGVSESAARDQRTVEICLAEIDRCLSVTPRPNFVVLLGDRYGWCPAPARIPAVLLGRLREQASAEDRVRLDTWYRVDDNARPPEAVLQPRAELDHDDAAWTEIERALHASIASACDRLGLSWDQRRPYTASATELEVMRGALAPADADHVVCCLRSISGLPGDARAARFQDLDVGGGRDAVAARALEHLTGDLRGRLGDRVREYTARWTGDGITGDHLSGLCEDVLRDLGAIISEQLDRLERADPIAVEVDAHASFGAERASVFIGREAQLAGIARYIAGGDRAPLIVTGAGGSGKTALLARAAAATRSGPAGGVEVLTRFIGATPGSSDERTLLGNLVSELARRYDTEPPPATIAMNEWAGLLRNRLAVASGARPVVVFIDALDQLNARAEGQDFGWLPVELPEHASLIVSTLSGPTRERLAARLTRSPQLEVSPMPPADGARLLDRWLQGASRSVTEAQRRMVLDPFARHGLPLQLRLAFEEARRWPSYAPPESTRLEPTVAGLVASLLARLSSESNHGAVMVARSLGYLAAARVGLSEDELLDVLSHDEDVIADFRRRSPKSPSAGRELPVVVWSRLFFDLAAYMTEREVDGTPLLAFYHREIAEAVAARYLTEEVGGDRHRRLARYFGAQALEFASQGRRAPNLRKLAELPYQQTLGGSRAGVIATLTDVDFLAGKAVGAGVEAQLDTRGEISRLYTGVLLLLGDLDLAIECWPDEDREALGALRRVLALSTHVLVGDPWQLRGQIVGRLGPDAPGVAPLLQGVRADSGVPWLRPLTPTLAGPGGALLATLTGWDGHVQQLAITPDGNRLITGGLHGALSVWDARSGARLHNLRTFRNGITALAVTADGRRLLVGAGGGARGVWELESGRAAYPLAAHPHTVEALGISIDGRTAVSVSSGWFMPEDVTDGLLCRWELATGRELTRQAGYGRGRSIAVQPDSSRVLMTSPSHVIDLWDAGTRQRLRELRGHTSYVRCAALTPDGRLAITGAGERTFGRGDDKARSDDCALRVWDLGSGTCRGMLRGHTQTVLCAAVSADGRLAVSGAADHTVRVWDLETLSEVGTYTEHAKDVQAVALTPDGRLAASASDDKTVKVWDLRPGRAGAAPAAHRARITAIAASPVGETAVSADDDGVLNVWSLRDGGLSRSIAADEYGVSAVAVTPDGALAIAGGASAGLTAWNLDSGALVTRLDAPWHLKAIATDAAGRRVAAISEQGKVVVCDLPGGRTLASLDAPSADVLDTLLALTPDGTLLVHPNHRHGLIVRDAETGATIRELAGEPWLDGPPSYAVTPDLGRLLVTAGGKAVVWALDGRRLHVLSNRTDFITCAALSPDGRLAVIAELDRSLTVWDLVAGRVAQVLTGHSDSIQAIHVTADGRRAITAAQSTLGTNVAELADYSVKVWDLERGGPALASFSGDSSLVGCVVAPDERTIVTGEQSGRVHILRLEEP